MRASIVFLIQVWAPLSLRLYYAKRLKPCFFCLFQNLQLCFYWSMTRTKCTSMCSNTNLSAHFTESTMIVLWKGRKPCWFSKHVIPQFGWHVVTKEVCQGWICHGGLSEHLSPLSSCGRASIYAPCFNWQWGSMKQKSAWVEKSEESVIWTKII